MDQLVLDLSATPPPSLDNFLQPHNHEVLAVLRDLPQERFVYLWGEAGCGKTHLLQGWVKWHASQAPAAHCLYVDAKQNVLPESAWDADFIALDHVEALDAEQQIALFSVYNALKERGQGRLLMAGRLPPMQLSLRDDLRTRLGWGLVFEVQALSDDDKLAALQNHAQARQLPIADEVYRYLLTHWRRDLPSLIGLIDALDHYSLALRRPITVPLVKNALQTLTVQL